MEGVAVMVNNNNNNSKNNEEDDEMLMELPPGFRFHPTDEEIITHYLTEKVVNCGFSAKAIGEVDMNKCEPWDLPKRAKMGEKEWFFFCQRDRKYPTGMRTNRATESGYWKATGKDKEIFNNKGGIKGGGGGGSSSSNNSSCLVGMKKTLVFYKGRAPKGEKTNWVMHEYRLEGRFSYYNFPKPTKDEWVVCRVFHKSNNNINAAGGMRRDISIMQRTTTADSFLDHIFNSPSELPPLMDLHDDNRLLLPPPPPPPGGGGAVSGSSAQLISEEEEDDDGGGKFTQEENNFHRHILMPNYNEAFKNSYQLDTMMMMMRNNNNDNSMVISPSQEISSTSTSTSSSVMKKIGRNPSRTFDQLGQELNVLHHNQGTVGNSLSDLDSLWDYRDY